MGHTAVISVTLAHDADVEIRHSSPDATTARDRLKSRDEAIGTVLP